MRRYSFLVLAPLLAGVLFWAGFQTARDDDFYAMRKNFELFGSVYEQVVGSYMVRVDPERFMRTGMNAMLGTLDPWTDFLDEADNVAMELRGQSGLGEVSVNLGTRDGRVTVLAPDAMTGAYAQGVRTGDVVERVAGQSAEGLTAGEVRQLLQGEPRTTVPVVIVRQGVGEMEFNLKREPPVIRFVSYAGRLEGTDVGLVRLDAFGPGASREIDDALEQIEEDGPLRGAVLDLRDNPGGLVNEAIAIVGLFVPKNTPVVSTRGRAPEANRLYSTNDDPDWGDLDLVVLVNDGSASASEIVSGALQDLDRAVIVGESTFGKGLVQVVRPLPYHTAIKLTYSRYFTPAGRGIRKDALEEGGEPAQTFRTTNGRTVREGNGIEPDVRIDSPEPTRLEQALLREAAYFRFAGDLALERGSEIRASSAGSDGLVLPNDTVARFRQWLVDAGFEYESEYDAHIDALEAAELPGSQGPVEQLRALAEREEERAFQAAGSRIMASVGEEVAARLLEPEQRIALSLRSDGELSEAVAILEGSRHDEILGS